MAKQKNAKKKSAKSDRTLSRKTTPSKKKKVKAEASKSTPKKKKATSASPMSGASKAVGKSSKAPKEKATALKTSKPTTKKPKMLQFRDPISPLPTELQTSVTQLPSRNQLRKVKKGLSRKDLEHYRQLLMNKRVEILGDVAVLENEIRAESDEHPSPEHMADSGSSSYEQEFTLGLVESERRMLGEIDEALLRIKDHTYGACLERAVPIGKERLDAKPWAKYCIEVVRAKEGRGEL